MTSIFSAFYIPCVFSFSIAMPIIIVNSVRRWLLTQHVHISRFSVEGSSYLKAFLALAGESIREREIKRFEEVRKDLILKSN